MIALTCGNIEQMSADLESLTDWTIDLIEIFIKFHKMKCKSLGTVASSRHWWLHDDGNKGMNLLESINWF